MAPTGGRTMRLRHLFLPTVLALAFAAPAQAGNGTFTGAVTATACGPMHEVAVQQGDTTIDAAAAEAVSANDITLDLYDPSGKLLTHGDTATSPESVHYASDNLAAGTYHVQVCPFTGGVVSQPYDYAGSWATSDGPVIGVPGSVGAQPGPSPAVTRVAGKLLFSAATVV